MIQKKDYQVGLFVVFCILLNHAGALVMGRVSLPLWMDSFGTVIAAYVLGPACGVVVGITGNIITSVVSPVYYIYGLTSVAIGLIVGFYARKKYFDTFFGTMSVSMLVTLASVAVSVPLNWIINGGIVGNTWGQGVSGFLQEQGIPVWISSVIGQFYIDFLDKVITMVVLYLLIKLRHKKKEMQMSSRKAGIYLWLTGLSMGSLCYLSSGTAHVMAAGEGVSSGSLLKQASAGAKTSLSGDNIDFNSYIRTEYSSDNGLACGEANDVVQTNDGVLWIGTYAGLYRYNGSEFRWMDEYDSVRNVNCLYVDEEGRLWIGTNDKGLSICIHEEVINVVDTGSGLPSDSVRDIVKSSDGYYYIGTSSGMAVLSLSSGLKVVDILDQISYTDSIAADQEGHAAVLTSDGKLSLLKAGKVLSSMELDKGSEHFSCCTFGTDGRLYAGTSENHIYVYTLQSEKLKKEKKLSCENLSYLNSMSMQNGKRLFICADNGIGYLEESGDFVHIKTGGFNNSIDNMTVDYQGNYWFTSSRMGLLCLSESVFTNLYSAAGMENRVVNSTELWKGDLYVGTDTGLDILSERSGRASDGLSGDVDGQGFGSGGNKEQMKNKLTQLLDGVRIRCIQRDSSDNLWLCTYGKGLLCISADDRIRAYDSSHGFGDWARLVTELSDGTVAAAGDAGVAFFRDGKVAKLIRYEGDMTSAAVLTLLEQKDGSVLAGSDGDGIAVLKDGRVKKKLTAEDGLPSGVILRMVADGDGEGTFIVTSNSLCYMDADFKIRTLDNFPYYNNYDLVPGDEGKLFVLGSAGIYVVDREELLSGEEDISYELLDVKSGLNSALTVNSWNYLDDDGNLYLSCDSGVYRMNLNNYHLGKRSYRMMVSSVRLDGTAYELERGSGLDISRETEKIEIFPEVINYTIEDPYVSYYLEGFDSRETVIPQSELTSIVYTNLPSGSYTFHLSVLDSDQKEILEQSSYSLVKEKEIYDNRWFRIYMLAVALIFVAWMTWLIVRTQIQRTINFQKRELEFAREQLRMGNETILAIAGTVDARDKNTSQHSVRVSEYSVMIAEELGFDEAERENLRKAALLHDIGKIGIPDRILNKPAHLTDTEYAVMKSHVTRGAEILKDFTLVDHVVDGAKYHHERYDGTGYMEGLKGEEIPLYGRIIGVADAFDAMTANRVYRNKLDFDYVLNELKKGRGTQFDPEMVDIMLRLIEEKKIDVDALYQEV